MAGVYLVRVVAMMELGAASFNAALGNIPLWSAVCITSSALPRLAMADRRVSAAKENTL